MLSRGLSESLRICTLRRILARKCFILLYPSLEHACQTSDTAQHRDRQASQRACCDVEQGSGYQSASLSFHVFLLLHLGWQASQRSRPDVARIFSHFLVLSKYMQIRY